jgi:hypothetical protein
MMGVDEAAALLAAAAEAAAVQCHTYALACAALGTNAAAGFIH